jgi:hypothetical protein
MFLEGRLLKPLLVLISAVTFAVSPFVSWDFSGFDPQLYPVPQVDPAVQPAGWAFAIWSLIYIVLIFHAAFGLFQHKDDKIWNAGRLALFTSLAVGTFWLSVAVISPVWATVLIWVMLIFALISLYQAQGAAPAWQAGWPVALYAGWLTAASFVSIGLLLAGYGVLSESAAAIVALVLATVFALVNQYQLRHWTYGLAVVWGFVAISAKNSDTQMVIAGLAAVAALLVLGLTVTNVVPKKHA